VSERFDFAQVNARCDADWCTGLEFCAVFLGEDVFDDFGAAPAFVDVPGDLLDLCACDAEVVLVWVGVGGFVDDGTEEEGVFEQPLDGFDEEGCEVPCV